METVEHVELKVKTRRGILTIQPSATVAQAALTMSQNKVGALIVVDDRGHTLGIITERDIMNRVVAASEVASEVAVEAIMTNNLISCPRGTLVSVARALMAENRIRHLPIVEDGAPVGMISSRDLLAYELYEVKERVREQDEILTAIEAWHPGITKVRRDNLGTIIID